MSLKKESKQHMEERIQPMLPQGQLSVRPPSPQWEAHLPASHGERKNKDDALDLLPDELMAQDRMRQQGLMLKRRKHKKKMSAGRVSRQRRLAPWLPSLLCRRPRGYSGPLETLASSSVLSPAPGFGLRGRCSHWTSSWALAGQAPSAAVAATKAREAKAPGGDGHSLLTQDATNGS